MCRLLAYLGPPIQPKRLIFDTPHSLELQSYRPKETLTTSVNADGTGLGWYGGDRSAAPFIYRSELPIWSDVNLPEVARYVVSDCFLAYVRSATPGLGTSIVNCQPFGAGQVLFIHNGFIEGFRRRLYRRIREQFSDATYEHIRGTTDSEHMFGLVMEQLSPPGTRLEAALVATLALLQRLAEPEQVPFSANIVLTDGQRLVASRFAVHTPTPTLYFHERADEAGRTCIVASEPLFPGEWRLMPEHSLVALDRERGAEVMGLRDLLAAAQP